MLYFCGLVLGSFIYSHIKTVVKLDLKFNNTLVKPINIFLLTNLKFVSIQLKSERAVVKLNLMSGN